MKIKILHYKTLVILLAIAGCGHKLEYTRAIQVYSPPEQPATVPAAKPDQNKMTSKTPRSLRKFRTTKSGVKYYDLKIGQGAIASPNCRVTVHYTGWLDNGTIFDSSRTREEPYTFTLGTGEVIRGLDEGIRGMRVGGVRELIVPPSLAYGRKAAGRIPPNSTLHFRIELLSVTD